jgi:RecA-family ATPase
LAAIITDAQPWADYLDVREAFSTLPPPLDFVFPGVPAGTLAMLVSAGGTGKSIKALQMAISVAAGQDYWNIWGEHPGPGRVIVLSAEDPSDVIRRRLFALQASRAAPISQTAMDNLRVKVAHGKGFFLGNWDGKDFSTSSSLALLAQEIAEFRPRLLVLDTLNRCLAGVSENDNAAMGRVIAELERIIAPIGCAALVLHHTSKATALGGQGDQQQAARGAGALTDNARFQMNLTTMTDTEAKKYNIPDGQRRSWVRTTVTKCNYIPAPADRWFERIEGGVLQFAAQPKEKSAGAYD